MFPKTSSTSPFCRKVRPSPQAATRRGPEGLIARLKPLAIEAAAVEATEGFEAVVAASLAAEELPVPCHTNSACGLAGGYVAKEMKKFSYKGIETARRRSIGALEAIRLTLAGAPLTNST
jgi:hypothetical protein